MEEMKVKARNGVSRIEMCGSSVFCFDKDGVCVVEDKDAHNMHLLMQKKPGRFFVLGEEEKPAHEAAVEVPSHDEKEDSSDEVDGEVEHNFQEVEEDKEDDKADNNFDKRRGRPKKNR